MPTPTTTYPVSGSDRPPLRRVRDERLIAGVCSGIARSLGLPIVAVRIIALAAGVIVPPLALLGYAGLALAIPRDDGRNLLGATPPDRRETVVGWAIIVIGLIALASGIHSSIVLGPGGFILLAAGLVLLVIHHQRGSADSVSPPIAPTGPTASATATHTTATVPHRHPLPYPQAPRVAATVTPPTPASPSPPAPGRPDPTPTPGPRERSIALFGFAAVLAGIALTSILTAAGAIDLTGTGVAIALGIGALALTAAAVIWARRRGAVALIVLAVMLAMGSLLSAAAGDHLEYGIGERTVNPVTAAQLAEEYRFGAGQLTIDLTRSALPAGTTTVRGRLGFGELVVRVPNDVTVISAGPTGLSGTERGEIDVATGPRPTVQVIADVDHGDARVEYVDR